ncbi:hypothetical protein GH733_006217 [Mirounga leonina]|nr:hypothetical protein GH733_006217 [Mirounga leonina]
MPTLLSLPGKEKSEFLLLLKNEECLPSAAYPPTPPWGGGLYHLLHQYQERQSDRLETLILDVTKTESISVATQWVKEYVRTELSRKNPCVQLELGKNYSKSSDVIQGAEEGKPKDCYKSYRYSNDICLDSVKLTSALFKERNNVTLDVRQVILDVTLPKRWFDNVMLNSHENILSFTGVERKIEIGKKPGGRVASGSTTTSGTGPVQIQEIKHQKRSSQTGIWSFRARRGRKYAPGNLLELEECSY